MALAYVQYEGASVRVLPASAKLADWSVASRTGEVAGLDLFSVTVDASVSVFWFLFDGASTPTTWDSNVGYIDLNDYGVRSPVQFPFSYGTGKTIYCYPRGLALSDWATYRIKADEDDTGLYVVTLPSGYDVWDIFEGASQPARWSDAKGTIYATSNGIVDNAASITNTLSVDYEDDYMYLDGIEDLGFAFDSQRSTTLVAPTSGVKAKRASPTHPEVIMAASTVGYEQTDMVFVVWAKTLQSGTTIKTPIVPRDGDKLIAFDTTWVIKSLKINVDHSEYRCYCRRSTKQE